MSKFPWPKDLKDDKNVVAFLKKRILQVRAELPTLSKQDQESAAASIVHLLAYPEYQTWVAIHPEIEIIVELAADLEWSNHANIKQAWEQLEELSGQL